VAEDERNRRNTGDHLGIEGGCKKIMRMQSWGGELGSENMRGRRREKGGKEWER